MVQQGGVVVVKGAAAAAFHLVGGRRQIVAAQYLGDAAQGPQGILQPLLQRQEGLTGGISATPRVAEYREQQVAIGWPAMVTRSQWVKSIWASRPGGCSWGKYTSRLQILYRRCSVRSWDALTAHCSSNLDNCRRQAAAQSHPPTPRRRG